MGFLISLCFVLMCVTCLHCKKDEPLVTVEQGALKGAVKQLLDGSPYYSFKGIPYAEPPVGKLRFMAPRPPKPWKGTYEAIEHGAVCTQYDGNVNQYVEGSEDCLFLNVYTKSLKSNSKIPVMVFIHGGGFMSGNGDANYGFGPEFLLQHNAILVTLNYRLEVLGFLSLDTPEVPGNAGLKDQVAALKWVKKNIAKFGGDPDNVTLFGESAGSGAVLLHMQSKMSKGLFQKAIAQSGSSTEDWTEGARARERAFQVGKLLGKDTTDDKELLEFLQSVPALNLTNLNYRTLNDEEKVRGLPIQFTPVLEKRFPNVESFVNEKAIDALLSRQVANIPLLIGYNSDEGILLIPSKKKVDFYNKNPRYEVPKQISSRVSEQKEIEMGDQIKRFYFGDKDMSLEDAAKIADMLTDIHFAYNVHRFAYFHSAYSKSTYMYRFSFDSDLNVVKNFSSFRHLKGACHADDLFYLFYSNINKQPYEDQAKSRDYVYTMTKIWTDFAKTGNPTPDNSLGCKWAPYTQTNKEFMDLNEKLTPGEYANRKRMDFWNRLYCEAGLPCIAKSRL